MSAIKMKPNFKLKTQLIAFAYVLLAVVLLSYCEDKNTHSHKYKYMVWVGSATFSVGYETDNYKDTLGYFTFTKKDNTISMYKSDKILRVDINNVLPEQCKHKTIITKAK